MNLWNKYLGIYNSVESIWKAEGTNQYHASLLSKVHARKAVDRWAGRR